MRVLNISLEKRLFENGSAPQKRVLEYAKLFDRFDLLVMSGKGHNRLLFEKMEIWPTNSFSRICYLFDAYKLGKKMIKKHGNDLVSVQDPFEMGVLGWFLAKKFKIKFQVQLHGDFFSSDYWRKESLLNRIRYYLGKFIVKKADAVRAVSMRVKDSVVKMGVADNKIATVPIHVEITNNQKTMTRQKIDKFIFLTAGRLVKVKNIAMQIKAMAEIVKIRPEAELWVVGDGPLADKLKVKSEKLKVENNVKFFGWRNDLENFYGRADVFMLTSNYDGWGMVAIEAAGFGLPLIMTDVGCAGEVIRNGESGIVIPPGDKKALARAMINLIEDASLRQQLAAGASWAVNRLPGKEENLKMYKEACEKAMLN